MGFIMFLARKMQLNNQKSNYEYQLMSITNKLQDYTQFASILSQDSISMSDIASLPTSLFMTGMAELGQAHNMASNIAMNQYNMAMGSGMFGNMQNQNVQIILQQKLYENARRELQKQLRARMNEEEKSLQNQKDRLTTQIAVIEKELESMDQKIAGGIKNQVAGYGLQA